MEEIVKDYSVYNGIVLFMNDDLDVKLIIVVGKFGNFVLGILWVIIKKF